MDSTEKPIYPNVRIEMYSEPGVIRFHLGMMTYLRKQYRKKYYLQKFYRETEVLYNEERDANAISEINHFHAEVYKSIILGKVDLKLVFRTHWGLVRHVFELDPDQTSEEERLTPKI